MFAMSHTYATEYTNNFSTLTFHKIQIYDCGILRFKTKCAKLLLYTPIQLFVAWQKVTDKTNSDVSRF